MATLLRGLKGAALADGNGGNNQVQLLQVNNTGSDRKQLNGSNFIMAMPGGPATGSASSILQHIALTSCQQLPQLQTIQQQNPAPQLQTLQQQNPAPQSKPRRSRKQKLPDTKLSESLPSIINIDDDDEPVQIGHTNNVPVVNAPPVQRGSRRKQNFTALKPVAPVVVEAKPAGSRRKRKSPVRSTMADILGEPEFVETYYLDESGSSDGEFSNNVLHLMKERQRRREMTNQFESLARLVGDGNEKESRNKVLQLSKKEVLAAKKEATLLKEVKQSLREKNKQLRKQLAKLLGVRTKITYESEEEEECEKVGGFSGYKSSSSDPDNNDDDVDLVDWGSSVEDSDDDAVVDFKDESESEPEPEDNVKVELPADDFYEGDREEEEEEEEEADSRARVKDEPVSDHDGDTEDDTTDVIDSRVVVKPEPIDPAPEARYSPKSSVVSERTEEELDLYDRYDRVKIEPRSPVRRALFSDSGSQDEDERTMNNDMLASVGLDQPDHFSEEFSMNNDIGDLAQSLTGSDMPITLDPGLIKEEDSDSNW